MRLSKREIVSREKIDEFIRECSVVRIGMLSEGEPYIVPLNFVYFEESIYFHCAGAGRKIDAIRKNPLVCLEFDELHGIAEESADTLYTSVIAWGSALEERNPEIAKKALELICSKYLKQPRVITDKMVAGTTIVSVRIDRVTGKENLD